MSHLGVIEVLLFFVIFVFKNTIVLVKNNAEMTYFYKDI